MPRNINMFIIYAREDKDIKLRLLRHLNPFINALDYLSGMMIILNPDKNGNPMLNPV